MLSYGERSFPTSHDDIPIHGFILGDKFVAHDSAVRCLSKREKEQLSADANSWLCHTGFSLKKYDSKELAEEAALAELIESMSRGSVEEYIIGADGERKLQKFGPHGESYALGPKKHIGSNEGRPRGQS